MTTSATATKTTVTAVLPDGTTATRKTARVYTHAVAIFVSAESIIAQARKYIAEQEDFLACGSRTQEEFDQNVAHSEEQIAAAADRWSVLSWCGRHDLAVKALDSAAKWAGRSNLKIVEVTN